MIFTDNDKELIEQLNVISSEISSKFDGIHFEINSMKSAISTLNKKLEENACLLQSLSSNMENINKFNSNLCDSFDKKNLKEYITKLDSIQKELVKTNNNIISSENNSSSKLSCLSDDLMFITHKIIQSEKDLFKIQEAIKKEKKK